MHPNIVQFREIFLTPVHLAIVMEYAAGGDMFEYVIKHKLPAHGQGLLEHSARDVLPTAHCCAGVLPRARHRQPVRRPLWCGLPSSFET